MKSLMKILCLVLYYGIARYLPPSTIPYIGEFCRKIRYCLCKHVFKKCGKHVNVEYLAYFGNGSEIEVGDFSNIGINCSIPNNTVIGNHVMMGPNCYILSNNHKTDRLDIPMCFQGHCETKQTIIGDDIWIGRDVLMTAGRNISNHSIIGAGCVLTKDFPEYSIIGGNPSKLIKYRQV